MPPIEVSDLHQYAVLWPYAGSNDSYGMPKCGPATELDPALGNGVRWKFVDDEFTDASGNVVKVDAIVVVAQAVTVHSVMWLGSLASWLTTGSDDTDKRLMRVLGYHETPDIRNRCIRRTLGLARFRETLPTLTS